MLAHSVPGIHAEFDGGVPPLSFTQKLDPAALAYKAWRCTALLVQLHARHAHSPLRRSMPEIDTTQDALAIPPLDYTDCLPQPLPGPQPAQPPVVNHSATSLVILAPRTAAHVVPQIWLRRFRATEPNVHFARSLPFHADFSISEIAPYDKNIT